ncbi:ABC transporter permease [Paenarthrobacter sp. NCHU4564]|uniref:ABC transporter permease n=1 Tax=Paenarthrobacter sp. NCHU4564 TaxID=3451353 RepID=UPI003F9899FC
MSLSNKLRQAGPAETSRASPSPLVSSPAISRSRRNLDGIDLVRVSLWLATSAVVLGPLAAITVLAFSSNHLPLLLGDDVIEAGFNSLASAVVSAVGAVVGGTLLALLLDRTDLPGRHIVRLFALSPLLVPPFVGAIAWIGLAGPTSPLNRWWMALTGTQFWSIYGGDGVTFLLMIHSYPVAYIVVSAALRRLPSDLEQAARISGASASVAVWGITLPLLRPAMLSAFTLIAVSNLADFGIPSIVGLPERFVTLSTLVYRYIQSGTVDAPLEVLATIGVVLLVLAIFAMIAETGLGRRRWEVDAPATAPQLLALGRWRGALGVSTWLIVLGITLLPLLALLSQALLPAPGVPLTWQNLTLNNVIRAVSAPGTLSGATNSLVLSVLSAGICTMLGLAIGTIVTRTRAASNPLLRTVAMLPQAVPGLVIALGWLIIAPGIGLFNTPQLILCAYVTAFTAMVVQSVTAPLASTPLAIEEAARIAGATRLRAFWDISMRMALPAALAGGALVALTAVRELTISVLLLAPGAQTLGVNIFSLQQAGAYNAASALSLVITLVGLAGISLAARRKN